MNLKSKLESLLFVSIKPLSLKVLAEACELGLDQVKSGLEELALDYKENGRGLSLINNNNLYQIVSHPENSDLVKDFIKSEINSELSQPSLETLTIIAYRGPVKKLELDRIRGVNCSLILRNLLLRGLIEEKYNRSEDENYYSLSLDFVRYLGVNQVSDLPDYEKLNKLEVLDRINEEDPGLFKEKESEPDEVSKE